MRRLILFALLLWPALSEAQSYPPHNTTHATDCTALTTGVSGDICLELDSDRFFTCQPTSGICDTGAEWILTPAAGGSGYATVDDEDTPLTQRTTLNFEGAGITCADDTNQTTCTVPAGSFSSPGLGFIVDVDGAGTLDNHCLVAGDGVAIANPCATAGDPSVSVDSATVPRYVTGTATPGGTCQAGRDFYIETDANKLWSCTSTDTWTDTTAAGGATPTLAQVTAAGATSATLMTLDNGATTAGRIALKEDSDNGTNTATLIGPASTADVTITLPATTGTVALAATADNTVTDDNVNVGNGATSDTKAIPDCDDSAGNHLNYDTATNAFTCGTTGDGGAAAYDSTKAVIEDEFSSGLTTDGNIGNLGWTRELIGAGSISWNSSTFADHPGVERFRTGTTDNDGFGITLGDHLGVSAEDWEIDAYVMPETAVTSSYISFGFVNGTLASLTNTAGIRIWYDTDASHSTWVFQVCDSSTTGCQSAGDDTNADSEVSTKAPAAGTWQRLRIRMDQTGVGGVPTLYFSVGDGAAMETEKTFCSSGCTSTVANLPSAATGLRLQFMSAVRVASSSKDVWLDNIRLEYTTLARY